MRCGFRERFEAENYDGMMDDRFNIFPFRRSLPKHRQQPAWPQCAPCAAKFYLATHDAPPPALSVQSAPSSASQPASSSDMPPSGLADELRHLAYLYSAGLLDEVEYRAAKRRLIGDMP